ncbi:MAG: phosphoribosylformylglycinamidine synthase I [Anaerolineae bacterium]|nr:phosphoribosylformylglycinamidine synthase I [Anaerolineae bacterium]
MRDPRILVLHAPGTNRDREAALACEMAGGQPEIVHINQLAAGERELAAYEMMVLPGGFSYGDDLGAGRLWATDLELHVRAQMDAFVAIGKPVLGICNGFQALVKAGYLPGWDGASATLTFNANGRFECRWVRLRAQTGSPCLFLRDLEEDILCPVAHGEGRFIPKGPEAQERLLANGHVALTYVAIADPVDASNTSAQVAIAERAGYPANPNGSWADVAGICNARGNVLGLMPHPEDHIMAEQHPRWRRGEGGGLGLPLFVNGVRAARTFVG